MGCVFNFGVCLSFLYAYFCKVEIMHFQFCILLSKRFFESVLSFIENETLELMKCGPPLLALN